MSSEAEDRPEPGRPIKRRTRAEREQDLRSLIGEDVAGRYRITTLLGIGGMGAVYEAEHLGLGRKVAIKFIDREHAQSSQVMMRFAREARAASSIESEHIVSVLDVGTEGERPFLVMELLRGEDLGAHLKRVGKIGASMTVHIASQVLRGLADAHEAGIVHRDLKPDNVFLVTRKSDRAFVKIVDFGVSKFVDSKLTTDLNRSSVQELAITRAGTIIGTPLYMSPEQATAAPDLDARTDLYGLGAIMFECLTGRPPHVGETYEQILLSICMNEAPDVRSIEPSVPDAVAAIVNKALRKDRDARYGSARQMLVSISSTSSLKGLGWKSEAEGSGPFPSPAEGARSDSKGSTLVMSPADNPVAHLESGPGTQSLQGSANRTVRMDGASAKQLVPAHSPSDGTLASRNPTLVTDRTSKGGARGVRFGAIVATGLVATSLGAGLTVWGLTRWQAKGRATATGSVSASSATSRPSNSNRARPGGAKKELPAAAVPTATSEGGAGGADGSPLPAASD